MKYTDSKFELSLVTLTPLYPNFNLGCPDSCGGDGWELGVGGKGLEGGREALMVSFTPAEASYRPETPFHPYSIKPTLLQALNWYVPQGAEGRWMLQRTRQIMQMCSQPLGHWDFCPGLIIWRESDNSRIRSHGYVIYKADIFLICDIRYACNATSN